MFLLTTFVMVVEKMEADSSKPKWQIETYWSLSSPLTILVPSWKHVEIDLYLSEYILTLRMRGYMFGKDYQLHSVMLHNKEVVMTA